MLACVCVCAKTGFTDTFPGREKARFQASQF